MKKRITIARGKLVLVVSLITVVSLVLGFFLKGYTQNLNLSREDNYLVNKLYEINGYVTNNYLHNIDKAKLDKSISTAYMEGLNDKYAKYYTKDEWNEQRETNKGEFSGVGITATVNEIGYTEVTEVNNDSPANKEDVRVGDLILKINDEDIKNKVIDNVVSLLKGEENTTVKIIIKRGEEEIEKTLTRQKIEIKSVFYEKRDNIGYIDIISFTDSGAEQLRKAIDDLISNGVTGIIYDLRNNGGGTLSSVVNSLLHILPEGTIGTEQTLDGTKKELGQAKGSGLNIKMVALINNYTASASELFVCDLKDYNKAKLVGEKTYGKGVLQSTITLEDQSAIKFTTAYFNPAKSANFNGKGVEPDYKVELTKDARDKLNNGELSLEEDEQYKKAIEVLNSIK